VQCPGGIYAGFAWHDQLILYFQSIRYAFFHDRPRIPPRIPQSEGLV